MRTPVESDHSSLLKWENDEELWVFGDSRKVFTEDEIQDFLKLPHDLISEKQLRLMICTNEHSRAIGCIDLFDYDHHHLRAGLGILIYDLADRRLGFAKEAITLLVDYCKKTLNLKQLYCNIMENNQASKDLFTTCGFKHSGTKHSWRIVGKEWKDEWMFQLMLR
ncbi:MAG: GNAT family protein [Vicingaceae bacterium]